MQYHNYNTTGSYNPVPSRTSNHKHVPYVLTVFIVKLYNSTRMRWVFMLALPVVVLSQCISENDSNIRNDSSASIALYRGQQRFSVDFLRTMNDERKDQNIFFSPHSIYQSLLLSYFIAANETEAALQKALYLPESMTKVETLHAYGMEKFLHAMREEAGGDYEYKIANKMFVSNEVPTKECFAKLLNNEVEKIDFKSDPAQALNHINSWVANFTKNHIEELLPPDAISAETSVVLANAAYFKGLWKSKFLPEMTKKNDVFYSTTAVLRHVDMMRQKGTFNHMISEKLKAHIVELPYKGGDVSMIVILPRFENNAIDKLIKILDQEALEEILDFEALYPRPMEVEIPKFTVEETIDLKSPFERLGLSELFGNNSDFTTLTGGEDVGVRFTDARHKAKVEVDEEGTEAAAATAIFSFRSSRPLDPTLFRANHPFVYLIFDKVSQNILFLGAYKLPASPGKKAFMKKMRL